jgi:hypothetical protein
MTLFANPKRGMDRRKDRRKNGWMENNNLKGGGGEFAYYCRRERGESYTNVEAALFPFPMQSNLILPLKIVNIQLIIIFILQIGDYIKQHNTK